MLKETTYNQGYVCIDDGCPFSVNYPSNTMVGDILSFGDKCYSVLDIFVGRNGVQLLVTHA